MTEKLIAANGLLNRRRLLGATLTAAGAGVVLSPLLSPTDSLARSHPEWARQPGDPPSDYGAPSPYALLKREQITGHPFGAAAGASSTPLQSLNGTITPNSLHFERHHSGIPAIDPAQHSLTIFGLVDKPLTFSCEDLHRYPLQSRTVFLECSGNSYFNTLPKARDLTAGAIHGLMSCAEWTGIPLHVLFNETGVANGARWIVAEGADASGNNRSIPLDLAQTEAMVALYQNGEPLRPAQGYPARLLVPGCEGNISIKWLRSIKVTKAPAHTREETSKYTDLLEDGNALQFSLRMETKSVITSPSGTMTLPKPGIFEITGLAWSGQAAIKTVEVSADGGNSWAKAELQSEAEPLRPVRFRIPWQWQGQPAKLQSRATDALGHTQPTRTVALQGHAPGFSYHFNGIQTWHVDNRGRVSNSYA